MRAKRTQIYLTPRQHRALKLEAERRRVSMTELVRRLIEQGIEGRSTALDVDRKEAVLAFIGLGASGERNTSTRHDEALDEALRAGAVR